MRQTASGRPDGAENAEGVTRPYVLPVYIRGATVPPRKTARVVGGGVAYFAPARDETGHPPKQRYGPVQTGRSAGEGEARTAGYYRQNERPRDGGAQRAGTGAKRRAGGPMGEGAPAV